MFVHPFQKLLEFENSVGIEFNHIRLLARAFSDRSLGNSNLTLGSNQRLEFLGDTVLQLVSYIPLSFVFAPYPNVSIKNNHYSFHSL